MRARDERTVTVLGENSEKPWGVASPPPLRPRVKLCESFLVESPNLYLAFIKTILAGVLRTFGIPLRFLSSKPSFLHDHFTTQHSDLVNRSIHANVFT